MANKTISQARISQEIRSLQKQKLTYLYAEPLENDIFTWHFTIQGPENTDFHCGLYHGEIFLPFQYPFKPPDMVFMNHNGRFQINVKICLTITQYHPQQWNSAWTIRTMLEGVISLFNQNVQGIGFVGANSQTRKYLAKQSHNFVCNKCGALKDILKPRQQNQQNLSSKIDKNMPIIIQQNIYQDKQVKKSKINIQKQQKIKRQLYQDFVQGYNKNKYNNQIDRKFQKDQKKKKIRLEFRKNKKQRKFQYKKNVFDQIQQMNQQYEDVVSSIRWVDEK